MSARRRTVWPAPVASLAAASLAVLMAGCGGSATKGSPPTQPGVSTATTVTEEVAAARAEGQDAVLRLSDLPEGWNEKPHEVTPEDLDLDLQLAACLNVDPAQFGTDNPTRAYSPDLELPSAASEVQNSVVFLASPAQAAERLATLERAETPGCLIQSFSNLIRGPPEETPPGGERPPIDVPGQVAAQREPFPGFGDGTVAYFVSVPLDAGGDQAVVYGDLVLAIKGRAAATFTFLGVGTPFPSALATQLTQTVVDRLPA